MTRELDRAQTLALAVWLTALIWPYTHSGGFPHPFWLSMLPLMLALTEWIPQRLVAIGAGAAAVLLEVIIQQPGPLSGATLARLAALTRQLGLENPAAWVHMSPLLGLVLILLATVLGWLVFRQAETRQRILLLFVLGILVLAVNHVYWQLSAEAPLAAYLFIGLWLLAEAHLSEMAGRTPRTPRPPWYGLAAVMMGLPFLIGWNTPAGPSHVLHPTGIGAGGLGAVGASHHLGGGGLGDATTGLGIGDAYINHAVKPSLQPVLSVTGVPQPAYWQEAVYTTFSGTTWSAAHGPAYPYDVGEFAHQFFPPDVGGFPTTTWTGSFTILQDGGKSRIVVYTGTPVEMDSASSLTPGTVYPDRDQVNSPGYSYYNLTMQVPDINWLAVAAATSAPAPAVLAPDLQLPASLSPKVAALARSATQGARSPWQQAEDIKTYLDQHEHYSYDFKAAPSVDAVNQFLFVTHAGYCDQFSTAFIMMMRSLGVPARWVVGYAPGTWQPRYHDYLIRAVDAHSWAQIYVAPYGWIPIDPTPGFTIPGIQGSSTPLVHTHFGIRPPIPPSLSHRLPRTRLPSVTTVGTGGFNPWPWVAAVLMLGLAAVLLRRGRRRRARHEQLWSLLRQLSWLTQRTGADAQAATLRDRVLRLPSELRPLALPALVVLERAWYAGQMPADAEWTEALTKLQQARRQALSLWIRRRAG